MGKKSKKNNRDRTARAQAFHESKKAEKAAQKDQAIRSKLNIPKGADIPTAGKTLMENVAKGSYVLSFHFYRHDCCELSKIIKVGQVTSFIKSLDTMSKTTPNRRQEIIRDTIYKKDVDKNKKFEDYKKMFTKLPPDQDSLDELQFSGQGRIFFFTTESPEKNFVNIVSVKPNHLNIDS